MKSGEMVASAALCDDGNLKNHFIVMSEAWLRLAHEARWQDATLFADEPPPAETVPTGSPARPST